MALRPEFILYIIGGMLILWGTWLAVRAVAGRRVRARSPLCDGCERRLPSEAAACAACGAERASRPHRRRAGWGDFAIGATSAMLGGVVIGAGRTIEAAFAAGEQPDLAFSWILPAGLVVSALGLWVLGAGLCRARPRLKAGAVLPRRRRWLLAMLGLTIAATGQLGWVDAAVRRGGWLATVPTDLMIEAMDRLPADWILESEARDTRRRVGSTLLDRLRRNELTEEQRRRATVRAIDGIDRHRSEAGSRITTCMRVLADLVDDRRSYHEPPSQPTTADMLPLIRISAEEIQMANQRSYVLADFCRAAVVSVLGEDDSEAARQAVEDAVAPHVADLVGIVAGPGGALGQLSIELLALGPATPEVLDALVAQLDDDEQAPTSAYEAVLDFNAPNGLVALATRHPAAAGRVAELLEAGTTRRLHSLCIQLRLEEPISPRIGEALLALLASDDYTTYTAASTAITVYRDVHGRAAPRLVDLIERDPGSGPRLGRALSGMVENLPPHAERLLELTRSEWAGTRRGAWTALAGLFREGLYDRASPGEPLHSRIVALATDAAEREADADVLEAIQDVLWHAIPPKDYEALDEASQTELDDGVPTSEQHEPR